MTYKSVGPCCGYVSYYDCTDDVALGLDEMLTQKIYEVYNRQMMVDDTTGEEVIETNPTEDVTSVPVEDVQQEVPQEDVVVESPVVTTTAPIPSDTSNIVNRPTDACQSTTYSDWSTCSQTCGDGEFNSVIVPTPTNQLRHNHVQQILHLHCQLVAW